MRIPLLAAFCAVVLLCLPADPALTNPMSTQLNFRDMPGEDYHSYNAGSPGQCASSCATNAECKAYTYVIATGTCWLKDAVPRSRPDDCCISGVKLMGDEEYGTDRPGSDLGPGFAAVTQDQCESACKNNPLCRSYTFVKPGIQAQSGMCWLKKRRPGKVDNACCISGVRLRDPVRIRSGAGGLTTGN